MTVHLIFQADRKKTPPSSSWDVRVLPLNGSFQNVVGDVFRILDAFAPVIASVDPDRIPSCVFRLSENICLYSCVVKAKIKSKQLPSRSPYLLSLRFNLPPCFFYPVCLFPMIYFNTPAPVSLWLVIFYPRVCASPVRRFRKLGMWRTTRTGCRT